MSLNPESFEAAQLTFKPMKRSRIARKASLGGKTPLRSTSRKQSLSRGAAKKPKKKKKLTTGQWKKKAWKEFSIFIRTFDANAQGMVQCCTCSSVKHWKELQAGHFIAGRLNSNLFEERGVHAQCGLCNVVKKGNGPAYYKFMLALYGQEVIDELMRQNDQTHKWLPGELQGLFEKYKALNAANPLMKDEK